jgi:predicted Zn-dependent protease
MVAGRDNETGDKTMPVVYVLRGLIPAVLAIVTSACAVNPVTGKNEVTFVSEAQETAIGQKNYAPYRQAQGGDYVADPELTPYVQSVGERIVRVSDRKLPYEFSVINDSSPNAWALPGGKISINRGLLVELDNEAELAAVLAHEVVHAAARHSAQSMERGVFVQGALIAAGVALGDSNYGDLGMTGANLGAQLTNQKFGRDDESEADQYGMRYMVRAGYDPAAAVRLQETFVRLAEGKESNWLAGLFASHPPSRARVAANRAEVKRLGNPGGELGEARYQKAIARLKRTKPAYRAYDEARAAFKKGELETALAKVNQAIRIEPKEASFYSLRGEIKVAKGQDKAALKDLDRAVVLNPDYYRPLLVRGMARREVGALKGANLDLERSVALLPTAEGYYGLGRVAQLSGKSDQAVDYFRKAATSQSQAGALAGKQLARLELQDHPSRYLKATLGLTQDGYLVVSVSNKAQVAVKSVRVVVGVPVGGGIREKASFRLNRTLAPGRSASLRTDLGPMDVKTARRYAAIVSDARLVE